MEERRGDTEDLRSDAEDDWKQRSDRSFSSVDPFASFGRNPRSIGQLVPKLEPKQEEKTSQACPDTDQEAGHIWAESALGETAEHHSSLREQVAKLSIDFAKTKEDLRTDWKHYAGKLARACQGVESWHSTIEIERANIASSLKKEVHDAFARELDGFRSGLRSEALEMQRDQYTEELSRACKAVETWRNSVEKDRANFVARLAQEVHDVVSKKVDARPMLSTSSDGDVAIANVYQIANDAKQLINVVSDRIDARVDRLSKNLDEETSAIRRIDLQFQELSNRLEVEVACHSSLKRNQGILSDAVSCQSEKMDQAVARAETAVKRLDEQYQSLSEKWHVQRERRITPPPFFASSPDPTPPPSPAPPRRTFSDDAPGRSSTGSRSECEFGSTGSNASTGYDSLHERVDDLKLGLTATEATVHRVSKQFEDVLHRLEVKLAEHFNEMKSDLAHERVARRTDIEGLAGTLGVNNANSAKGQLQFYQHAATKANLPMHEKPVDLAAEVKHVPNDCPAQTLGHGQGLQGLWSRLQELEDRQSLPEQQDHATEHADMSRECSGVPDSTASFVSFVKLEAEIVPRWKMSV